MNPTRQSHLRSSCLPFPTPLPPSLPPTLPPAHRLLRLCALLLQRQRSLTSSTDLSLLCAKRQTRNKKKKKKEKGPQRCEIFNSSQITGANRTLVTPLFVWFPCRETPDLQEKKKTCSRPSLFFVFCFCVFTVREERPAHELRECSVL